MNLYFLFCIVAVFGSSEVGASQDVFEEVVDFSKLNANLNPRLVGASTTSTSTTTSGFVTTTSGGFVTSTSGGFVTSTSGGSVTSTTTSGSSNPIFSVPSPQPFTPSTVSSPSAPSGYTKIVLKEVDVDGIVTFSTSMYIGQFFVPSESTPQGAQSTTFYISALTNSSVFASQTVYVFKDSAYSGMASALSSSSASLYTYATTNADGISWTFTVPFTSGTSYFFYWGTKISGSLYLNRNPGSFKRDSSPYYSAYNDQTHSYVPQSQSLGFNMASLTQDAQTTTAQMTTAQMTTAQMTTAQMTTAQMTTAQMTTAQMTTAQMTTAPMVGTTGRITSQALTTGSYSQFVIRFTSNFVGEVEIRQPFSSSEITFMLNARTDRNTYPGRTLYITRSPYYSNPAFIGCKFNARNVFAKATTTDGISWYFPDTFQFMTKYYYYLEPLATGPVSCY